MDNKLTLQQFANLLAADSECPAETVAAILKSLSSEIAADLLSCGKCSVNNLGEFKVVTTDEGYKTVAFQAQPTLADTINAPFSSFPTVDLDDDYTDPEETEELIASEAEQPTEAAHAMEESTSPSPSASEITDDEDPAAELIATAAETEEAEEAIPVTAQIPPIPIQVPPVPSLEEPPPFDPDKAYAPPTGGYVITSEEEEYINSLDSSGSTSALTWVIAIIAIILGIGALAFFAMNILL